MNISVVVLPHGKGLPLPAYQSKAAAGMDLRAAVQEPLVLAPLQRMAVPTGLKMAIPLGFEGQVRPRSGLAFRHGIGIPNAPGTIDADHRGEIKVLLINLGSEDFQIERGMRIAQLIIAPIVQVKLEAVSSLNDTERGEGGFGSTGKGL